MAAGNVLLAVFMIITRCFSQGRPVIEVKVIAPPPMSTMEQLLAVQNAISQAEQLIQDGNIILLKLRGLLLSIFPQATEKLVLAFLPSKYLVLLQFLEVFTVYSPPRKAATERWKRRMREWWFSIPTAPAALFLFQNSRSFSSQNHDGFMRIKPLASIASETHLFLLL